MSKTILDDSFIKEYSSEGKDMFMGTPIKNLSREELYAVIGFLAKEMNKVYEDNPTALALKAKNKQKYLILEGDQYGMYPYEKLEFLNKEDGDKLLKITPSKAVMYKVVDNTLVKIKTKQ